MGLRDSLEIYNTNNGEERDILDIIYRKVSKNYVAGSINSYKINKIIEAFNDFNYVLMKFEYENEEILPDIKKYIMGDCLYDRRAKELESRMKEWVFFFQDIGIEQTFLDHLISKYRENFIIQYSKQEKKQLQTFIYLEYLFLVSNLSVATYTEQLKILEVFKATDKDLINLFSEYIIHSDKKNVFTNKLISIDDSYIEKLMDEDFLLKTIKDIVDIFINQYNYTDYEQDLKRIYSIQSEIDLWVDINKLNNFIAEEKLVVLKKAHLIDEINEEHNHIIQLTEIGISMVTNQFIRNWESEKYFYEDDNMVLIPFNSNPF